MNYTDGPYDDRQEQAWRSREAIWQWFHECFYDPEEERRNGIVRHYRWPPGAQIDPWEVIQADFGRKVAPDIIQEIARELSARSTNWRSRPDEIDPSYSNTSTRMAPAHVEGRAPSPLDTVDPLTDLLTRLTALEAQVDDLRFPSSAYGHNNPPEPLDDLPATKEDILDLKHAIDALRGEALSASPQVTVLHREQGRLLAIGEKIVKWSGARGTKLVDAALETAGRTAGAAFVLSVSGLLPDIFEVAAAIERFIQAIV